MLYSSMMRRPYRWLARFRTALPPSWLVLAVGACTRPPEVAPPAATAVPTTTVAYEPAPIIGMRVDDFQLMDEQGVAHRLYDHGGAKAIVLMTQGNGCPIVRNSIPALARVRDDYAERGVQFFLLDSNLQDDRASIAKEAAEHGFPFPVLVDEDQLVGESLEVTRTAEVFVIDTTTERVVYHGPVDDRLSYGQQKPKATHHYLADALDAVLEGQAVAKPEVDAPGCLIDFPERDRRAHERISYRQTIAPLLQRKCVECHQDGGIGPWAMDGYAMVKGFSPMIREVLRTDRMPPWHADPAIGRFRNDKSLTSEELRTLVHWIEAGAPRDEGSDPLAEAVSRAEEWPLGEPDLVLTLPAFEVPATGVVEYQFPAIPNPLTAPRWLRASTVSVGSRETVHHLLSGLLDEIPKDGRSAQSKWGASVGVYAVGAESMISRDDVGALIPAGGAIAFQVHYTTVGRAVTDQTRVGLYFHDERPRFVQRSMAIMDTSIAIPAGARRHHEVGVMYFAKDALLYAAFPHAHNRGCSSSLAIRYPDGKEELVLSLPRYDFNWQRFYELAEPLPIPAGSRLVARYVYDNSVHNPANPDPGKTVTWGDYTFDEMLYTIVSYRWLDETSTNPTPGYDRLLVDSRPFDQLDDDLDDVLRKDELRGPPGAYVRMGMPQWDVNGDAELTRAEFLASRPVR